MTMNWKKEFSGLILERGHDYFLDDRVEDIQISADGYTATVCGTEDYHVQIELMNGNISDMSCTCPYAEDGKNCKHMAAVLFAVKTVGKDADNSASNKSSNLDRKELATLRGLLEAATPEQLRVFLLEQMLGNVALQQDFRLRFAESVSQEDMRCYKQMI